MQLPQRELACLDSGERAEAGGRCVRGSHRTLSSFWLTFMTCPSCSSALARSGLPMRRSKSSGATKAESSKASDALGSPMTANLGAPAAGVAALGVIGLDMVCLRNVDDDCADKDEDAPGTFVVVGGDA